MKYDTAWAKERIQEIKGTVKVEGTVEVQGKVQVEGTANKESLLKRGFMALEDTKWRDADGFFDKVLDIDPECAEAYLGKLMSELQVNKREELQNCAEPFDGSKNYEKALRFGDETLVNELRTANDSIVADRKRKETELQAIRERIRPAAKLISAGDYHTVGLKSDGTVVAVGNNGCGQCNVNG